MSSEPKKPDHPEKKLPIGTRKCPWYCVPEHVENGVKIPATYFRYSSSGIWMSEKIPDGSCIKNETSY